MTHSASQEKYGHPIQYDPQFTGPSKGRSCTDVICLFIFMVFIGCWAGIGIYAFVRGDPQSILVPKDSLGLRCGIDTTVRDKPNLFFFDLTKCIGPQIPFTGCPTPQICVKDCPRDSFFYEDEKNRPDKLICRYNAPKPTILISGSLIESNECAKWYLPSKPIQHRCVPTIDSKAWKEMTSKPGLSSSDLKKAISNINILSQTEQVGQNIVSDIISSWWKILIGLLFALLICILYIVLLRWVAGIMVWISIIGVVVALGFGIYMCGVQFKKMNDKAGEETDDISSIRRYGWLILLIVSSFVEIIILLALIFLRKRIFLAIALIKEGSKAVSSVTSVLAFPIFPWIFQILVIAFSIYVGLLLTTIGKPIYQVRNSTNPSCVNRTSCDPLKFEAICPNAICKFIGVDKPVTYPYMQTLNVFGFFWGTFFVSALGKMILAFVFATWYWTKPKNKLPFFALTSSTLSVLRYHLGTLAFGSLLVAICRMVRVVLEYIDKQLKKYDNGFTKAILCCMKCFFWCLEKFIKFINTNAYIMCAIHGKNFCASAKDAFMLLMRNILRVAVLDKVTDFLFFLSKVLLTVITAGLAYLCFATDVTAIDNSNLNYGEVPVVIIAICTYVIASIFFSVYSMAVDTLFLCFLEDSERNDGSSEKPYYMSKNLMKIFGKKNKRA